MTLICPDLLWQDGALVAGQAVLFEAGRVVEQRARSADDQPDFTPHILMPACTDLQVNGAGGVMLNSEPTPEGIATIVDTLRGLGTSWVLPTVITSDAETLRRTCDAMLDAWGMRGLLGLHIEGPHINVERKGTHNPEFIRPFEDETLDVLKRLRAADIPVMLTLAPETVPLDLIAKLTDMGVKVFAGHTMATADQTRAALDAGLRGFTHLYNAMPQMTSRNPGIIAAALASDGYAGIIADGHHVDWDMIALACRARPKAGCMFMVSDAMATIGGPDFFMLYGEKISVKDGALVNANGSLAGAHIDMLTCLRNMIIHVGIAPEQAIAMATDIPHEVMGLTPPVVDMGTYLGDCVALNSDFTRCEMIIN
ncbi:N-acetylglucosamine-6-phosphate deacetylase [Pacificibacter sp. AS14]|uniref:N-acetylglucosamine-6-phosphate deacetylase n=1 Tax=Pacificibacter sp. AS14 TaxID=3135785 RepID=UPI00317B2DE1